MTIPNDVLTGDSQAKLQSFVRRTLRLMEERDVLNTDIAEVMKEAKDDGFDTKILRKVVTRARMDAAKRQEEDDLVETYEAAVQGELFASHDDKVTITLGDREPIETDSATIQRAADEVGRRKGRRASADA